MRAFVLLWTSFFSSMSLSYVIRFSELDGLTNVTSSVEHLESRSLDERSRLGITCTGQHRVQIRNILRRVADRSQVALSATPVRPTGRTRFTGPIFERFFGTDNIGARTYVHERIDRVRRESLRTPGLRGFGLSRAMILCNEGYGSRDPCEPTDILITNRERSFMVLVKKRIPCARYEEKLLADRPSSVPSILGVTIPPLTVQRAYPSLFTLPSPQHLPPSVPCRRCCRSLGKPSSLHAFR